MVEKGFLGEKLLEECGERKPELFEISGTIKWYDISKGYGFIVPDDGRLGDVLVHASVLSKDGFQTVLEGSRVYCEVYDGGRGLQCFQVHNIDNTTAIHPPQSENANARTMTPPTSGLERAIVKWFDHERGYGFLTRGQGTEDIFIHMETLRHFGLTELRAGQVIVIRYGRGEKGLVAAEIYPDIGPYSPTATH